MKNFSIVLAIASMLLFIVPNFFYSNTVNAVDSGGSTEIVTYPDGTWTNKLPVFFGAAIMGIAIVFYVASRPVIKKNGALL
ncbi:hypothetical protein SAMN05428975_0296 [Mucilaginibacter sp. OK268]|uniref:hypothetical protein n=1 Tax=Mucilaginibacter sp. OK268 TaxID=1881048 RepID=UPI00088916EF|nr:hypothetical protein [Mucilaginibacter sp. OK268]SDP09731.1 hypothetical protein SAMN05428975_0296 [Mucilaginibacter sp. OK268]